MTAATIAPDTHAHAQFRRGRPTLGHNRPQGTGRSPRRSARLPEDLNRRLDAYLAAQGRNPSEVIRDALTEYLDRATS